MNVKTSNLISSCILVASVLHVSCKNDTMTAFLRPAIVNMEALEQELVLDANFPLADEVGDDTTFTKADFLFLYQKPKAIWFDKYGLTENATKLLTQLEIAKTEGLEPEDYFFTDLKNAAKDISKASASQLKTAELKMSYAYLKYAKHLLLGKITPLAIDKNWQNVNDSIWSIDSAAIWLATKPLQQIFNNLRPAHPWYNKFWLAAKKITRQNTYVLSEADLPTNLQLGDSSIAVQKLRKVLAAVADATLNANSMIWNAASQQALRNYQKDGDLEITGELDSATIAALTTKADEKLQQLGMNMERMRWLQKDFEKEFIWVNIPQMEVKYFEGKKVTFKMNAVVGKVSRKTPTLDSRMSNIVFNPPWYVPSTIMKQEIIPGVARRGGSYLRRRGLVARDNRGRIVHPSRINAKNFRRFQVMQNPGRNSALGSIKFNFPNKESIYLHDTNHREGFTRKYRATSSGCIRVHHPKDFAHFLLRDSTFSSLAIDSIIDKRKTKSINIERNIGVHLVYLTNAVDSIGRVIRVEDIYKWDEKLAKSLAGTPN